jgi:hypothetical protein
MGFASAYLLERSLFPEFIKEAPDENTGIIVVVPAFMFYSIPFFYARNRIVKLRLLLLLMLRQMHLK